MIKYLQNSWNSHLPETSVVHTIYNANKQTGERGYQYLLYVC